jgi:uncharacterized protein
MNKTFSYVLLSCVLILSFILPGCMSSRPANFYLLKPTVDNIINKNADIKQTQNEQMIGIGPIHLANHLQRKQIISLSSTNKLQIEEFERWAGELDENISYVLSENMGALMNNQVILAYPWNDAISLTYRVEIHIHFFTVDENHNVRLLAIWNIFDTKQNKLLHFRRSEIISSVMGNTINDQINAQNQALLELSRSIASQLNIIFAHNKEFL